MTKPNDFTLNSDYLSLAQTDSQELTAYFAAEHFEPGYYNTRTQDFTVPQSKGAIDMFLISVNGSDYTLGASLILSMVGTDWQGQDRYHLLEFNVVRTGPSTIQVQLHEFTSRTGGYDMPMQTVKVKVSSFKPPNIF